MMFVGDSGSSGVYSTWWKAAKRVVVGQFCVTFADVSCARYLTITLARRTAWTDVRNTDNYTQYTVRDVTMLITLQ